MEYLFVDFRIKFQQNGIRARLNLNIHNHCFFVCYESNLAEVPSNTWWIDSGATTHVTNLM